MVKVDVLPGKFYHCTRLSRVLRHEHYASSVRVGLDPKASLREVFGGSYLTRAWFFNDELSALGGVMGSTLSPVGFIWLAMSEKATRYPKTIVQQSRAFLDEVMATKLSLCTTVLGDDETALRFTAFLGFYVSEEFPGLPAFSKQGRRTLVRYAKDDPALRIPLRGGYAVRMYYSTSEFR